MALEKGMFRNRLVKSRLEVEERIVKAGPEEMVVIV